MATVERRLNRREVRVLAVLGVPTFALALGITVVSTYLPVLAERFSDSSIVIGLLIGGEGLMALWLPLAIGSWSDRIETPIGSRLPFILVATTPLVLSLAVLGFVRSIWMAAIVMAVFFAAYFIAYEPYRALYPDLLDGEIAGRAQSSQAIFRGLGTFLALLGGGLLFSVSPSLPFIAAAIVCGASLTGFTLFGIRRRRRNDSQPTGVELGDPKRVLDIVRGDRPLQAYLVANALWELALAALKTFVVLWVTKTLGFSLAGSSGVIAAGAAIVLVGALVSGPLGDRHGRVRVMRLSLILYGVGLLVPFLTTGTLPLLLAAPLIAFGGGVTMSLPYALLVPMMPAGQHGAVTGLYSLSRGLGISLGPLLGGIAVQAAGEDYKWVFLVCSLAILASIPTMSPLRQHD